MSIIITLANIISPCLKPLLLDQAAQDYLFNSYYFDITRKEKCKLCRILEMWFIVGFKGLVNRNWERISGYLQPTFCTQIKKEMTMFMVLLAENNCGGWQKNYFPGEEKPLHNSWPDQEHSPGGNHTVSTIKKRLHQSKYKQFTTRCSPIVYILWWTVCIYSGEVFSWLLTLTQIHLHPGECSWSGHLLWRGFSSPGK